MCCSHGLLTCLLALWAVHCSRLAVHRPTLLLRRRLRDYVARRREDDKEILFEGVGALSKPQLQRACEDRGLARGTRVASESLLRSRLLCWLELSKV